MNSMNFMRNVDNARQRQSDSRGDPQKPPKDHLVAGARFWSPGEEIYLLKWSFWERPPKPGNPDPRRTPEITPQNHWNQNHPWQPQDDIKAFREDTKKPCQRNRPNWKECLHILTKTTISLNVFSSFVRLSQRNARFWSRNETQQQKDPDWAVSVSSRRGARF